jgi:diguanylate cyclase (GGDEF)-like protein/putative nucleotidyltransferase with HDIG domain
VSSRPVGVPITLTMRALRSRGDLAAELAGARSRIASLEAEIAQRDSRDPLAGALLTLHAFRAQLELDVRRAQRYRRPLSVALLDVDGFRSINAKGGYPLGDQLLVAIGDVIARHTRAHDLACRTGGDEFAILLAETASGDACVAMERLLHELQDIEVGTVRGASVSVGVADLSLSATPEGLLAAAREGLEASRVAGGGRVTECPGLVEGESVVAGHTDVVSALASALIERDRYTGDHSESVVDASGSVAEWLATGPAEVERIRTAALLHDIGKIGIPDEILHKPGPLDRREWEVMRQHPVVGERILRAIPGMGRVATIVRHEHERWDGTGYPDRLAGPAIPLGSRIILACDAYHAMISNRPYRPAMSHADAVAELARKAGSQFDPDVVQVLVAYVDGRRRLDRATSGERQAVPTTST